MCLQCFFAQCDQGINIIAKKSFWISKPFKKSIMDALKEFKRPKYVEMLKIQITSGSIPTGHDELLIYLYNKIINLEEWW